MFGRNGDSSVAIVAPSTPSDCFFMAIEAFRIALKYMVPVIYLSDGYLGNGSEPWRIPSLNDIPKLEWKYATKSDDFSPYLRDKKTLARPGPSPARKASSTASVASRSPAIRATSATILATTTA